MAQDSRPLAICLMGPTASGKTALALSLCERLNGEIISVDSAQVYRGMDIGTAKPDADTLRRYPHRLIDIRDPAESYSAAAFREDALKAMQEIVAAGRTPLLVGGTMLYFRVLIHGMAAMPGADNAVRARIAQLATQEGWDAVHRWLARVDPVSAERIGPFNHQRMQRALEVFLSSGTPISELHAQAPVSPALPCRLLQIALLPADRAVLHRRIQQRFQDNAGGRVPR
jgi:tRNA dimethylallyltransferase